LRGYGEQIPEACVPWGSVLKNKKGIPKDSFLH